MTEESLLAQSSRRIAALRLGTVFTLKELFQAMWYEFPENYRSQYGKSILRFIENGEINGVMIGPKRSDRAQTYARVF